MKQVAFLGSILLTGSLTLNVALLIKQPTATSLDPRFEPGTKLPVIAGRFISEPSRTVLSFSGDTVVYVFSATCGWCRRDYQNLAAFDRLLTATQSLVLLTVDLDSDNLRAYLKAHPINRPVFLVDPALDAPLKRKLQATPQLLVISRSGRVQRHWVGALTANRQAEVESFFGFRLPGVTAPARPLN